MFRRGRYSDTWQSTPRHSLALGCWGLSHLSAAVPSTRTRFCLPDHAHCEHPREEGVGCPLSYLVLAWCPCSANKRTQQCLHTFSVNIQIVNILGFVSHMVSVTNTQLSECWGGSLDSTWRNGLVCLLECGNWLKLADLLRCGNPSHSSLFLHHTALCCFVLCALHGCPSYSPLASSINDWFVQFLFDTILVLSSLEHSHTLCIASEKRVTKNVVIMQTS